MKPQRTDERIERAWNGLGQARLEDERLLLRPIRGEDRDRLRAIAFDPAIWRYFVQRIDDEADLDAFVVAALGDNVAGRRIVFGLEDKGSGELIGSMAFGSLAMADRRIEIGWSWLGTYFRGRGFNRPAKLLLLEHAFERLGCERVEFKTDVLNAAARKALLAIGATEEGILRSYNYMPDGRRRDAIYYSILAAEWPAVRDALRAGGDR